MKVQYGFKTADSQKSCRDKIKAAGMTIKGWARINGFSPNTVMNLLSRLEGTRPVLPTQLAEIMQALRKDKYV